ncbi:MAG TPA: non-homologous end-joining DNA ligase [Mycobacteriales bacterium]|nr:non-homologous end-joining DNA ligase [Mycobacteriales bacterium]
MTAELLVRVAGRDVAVSSLDRVLFPATGTTKAEVIDYYVRVADALLPHLRGRPATLHRFPEGVGGPHFFQTRVPPHPPWLRTARMAFERTGKVFESPVLDDLPALVWAANLATIELHPFLGLATAQERPLVVVFDLDPGEPAGLAEACAVALRVRERLAADGLASWPKTSGSKGVHVYAPVSGATYGGTKAYARRVAAALTRETPGLVVDRMARALRPGKVLVDWSQNDRGKSTVAPYSLRALRAPTVSAPVTWAEVERGRDLFFGPADVPARLDRYGDLFAPVLTTEQRLPDS